MYLDVAWELPDTAYALDAWAALLPRHVAVREVRSREPGMWMAHTRLGRPDYLPALYALVAANLACIAHGVDVELGALAYQRECCGEVWRAIPALVARGGGDCEDLACLRVAQLTSEGVPCELVLQDEGPPPRSAFWGERSMSDGTELGETARLWHVVVARGDGSGRVEDPSRERGMGRIGGCDPRGPWGHACSVGG